VNWYKTHRLCTRAVARASVFKYLLHIEPFALFVEK
jgi:hypothetical protein